LQYATIKAPMKGIVSKKTVEVGQVVAPGQPLMTIIPLEEVWVTANFKETQLENMRPGQPQSSRSMPTAAATSKDTWRASRRRRDRASACCLPRTPRQLVKVVQRVPVRIAIDQKQKRRAAAAPRHVGDREGLHSLVVAEHRHVIRGSSPSR
jgi:membrane fusion protein (multidrug efflux system)